MSVLTPPEQAMSATAQIFTSDSFSSLLEEIILELPIKAALRICRASKHINQVVVNSAHIQLALRVVLHQLPIPGPPWLREPNERAAYGPTLGRLMERELRIALWTPKEIRCLHHPHSRMVDVQDGYILFEEHNRREPIFADGPMDKLNYKTDGWAVWKLSQDSPSAKPDPSRSGKKHQGLSMWKGCLSQEGGRVHAVAFCPQDDVVAVARRFGPVYSARLNINVFVNRVFFHSMRSRSSGQNTPEVHEEAALPFIELLTDEEHDAPTMLKMMSMQIIPGGRMLVKIESEPEACLAYCTVWDWKNGICLGRLNPWFPFRTIFSARFLTPDWLVCATFRGVDIDWEVEKAYDFGFEEYEYGGLLGFDVFALDLEPDRYSGPVGIGHGMDLGSAPCSWTFWNAKPAKRLCILYLPPIREHASYEDRLFDDDFRPKMFDIHCPVTTRLTSHMPDVLTFSIMGIYSGPTTPDHERMEIMQGVIPMRIILAAAFCGAIRNFVLGQSMDRSPLLSVSDSNGQEGDDEGSWTCYTDVEMAKVPITSLEEGRRCSNDYVEAFMDEDHDQSEDDDVGSQDREMRSSSPNSELYNYFNGTPDDEHRDQPLMIPWSILRKHCDISVNPHMDVPSSYGRRVFSVVDDNETSDFLRSISVMNMNDYSPLAGHALKLQRKPIGALDSESFGYIPLIETVTRQCPLPKPFGLPQISREPNVRVFLQPRLVFEPYLFAQHIVQCDLRYLHQHTEVSMDAARPAETVHFDGDRLILSTRNGAYILTF